MLASWCIHNEGKDMWVNEASLQAWAPRMLSVLRIMAALHGSFRCGLSKYFGFPANPPA